MATIRHTRKGRTYKVVLAVVVTVDDARHESEAHEEALRQVSMRMRGVDCGVHVNFKESKVVEPDRLPQ